MTVFYLDPLNGVDGNSGTSFASRWKSFTQGATAARIAPGDEIRVIANAEVATATAKWVGREQVVNFTISSCSNTTPIKVTTTTTHNFSDGDPVYISGAGTGNGYWVITNVTSNTFDLVNSTAQGVGAAGTVRLAPHVALTAPITKNIASCDYARTAWTGSTNVTASVITTATRASDRSDQFAMNATFTTGKMAYKAVNLNLSSYNTVSFYIAQTAGTLANANTISIRLCSDSLGATTVHTINVPQIMALNTWNRVTVNLGTAMSSSILSVALYTTTDVGAQTFVINNIFASNNGFGLESLIGKGTSGETYYSIQSITERLILLSDSTLYTSLPTNLRGYTGATETVSTRFITPHQIAPTSSESLNDSGTSGNPIKITGGWNRTDMSTQNANEESFYDFRYGAHYAFNGTSGPISYIEFDKISVTRASGFLTAGAGIGYVFKNFTFNNCGASPFSAGITSIDNMKHYNNNSTLAVGTGTTVNNVKCYNNAAAGFTMNTSTNKIVVDTLESRNNAGTGIVVQGYNQRAKNLVSKFNEGGYALSIQNCQSSVVDNLEILVDTILSTTTVINNTASFYNIVRNLTTNNTATGNGAVVAVFDATGANNIYRNITITNNKVIGNIFYGAQNINAVVFDNITINTNLPSDFCLIDRTTSTTNALDNSKFIFQKFGGSTTDHRIYGDLYLIRTDTTVTHSGSGYSWAISPTNSIRDSNPVEFSLAKVAVNANSLVTIKAWMRRTNTGLTMNLVVPGYQLPGITDDVVSTVTASADTWQEVTVTFTPTEAGVVEVFAEVFGGSTYTGYVDDMTITQA